LPGRGKYEITGLANSAHGINQWIIGISRSL